MPKLQKRIIPLLLIICLIAFILLCRWQQGVAEWYMLNIYPAIAAALSFISSKIPFSLFDTFITLYILAFLLSIVFLIIRKIRFKKWLCLLVTSIVFVFLWFYLSWGVAYFRNDFYARTDTPKAEFDSTNFKIFLKDYIDELNAAYIPVNEIKFDEIDLSIEESYRNLKDDLKIPYPCGQRKIKKMIYQKWVTKSGVSGYFGPFFNEVHVNRYPLASEQASIIAHEKAHQLGIASEAECNLYAYIACTSSNNTYVKYSGYIEVLGYVLNNIRKLLPNEYNEWYNKIKPEIFDDYNASYEHWQKGINEQMSEVQRKVYDAYLKTNNIKSGVTNYSEMIALLVSWHNNRIAE